MNDLRGLTNQEVSERIKNKQTNKVKKTVGKSYVAIFTSNILTLFNLIGIIVFLLMIFCASPSNMFFVVVILANTVIGIFQEIRSKKAIEKLSIVSEPTAKVVRNGEEKTVSTNEVVLDDVIVFSTGNQICADCKVLDGVIEVDESMLTGESVSVKKNVGDTLYSGSFVTSGKCYAVAEKVGKDSYVEKLSEKVKKTHAPNSQVMNSIRTIIKVLGIIIFPLGLATFLTNGGLQELNKSIGTSELWRSFWANRSNNWLLSWKDPNAFTTVQQIVNTAVLKASGSMIGMIPSGMVLLLAVSFAVSAIKLAQKKVLVRELPCIEMLARVDTLCLDKTGTITDGTMTVEKVEQFETNFDVTQLVGSLVKATGDDNATARAIKNFVSNAKLTAQSFVAFSSVRKYSVASFENVGTVVLGASEFMFEDKNDKFDSLCQSYLEKGLRVLAVGLTAELPDESGAVHGVKPVGVVVLSDTVRSDAPEIIKWFKDNDVTVKVISGDNPLSVSVIAEKVGIENANRFVSLEGLTDEQVAEVANEYTVFGRVTPYQKAILVKSMKEHGRTVAMTGDGVNDILAMRESDCAITVGAGTDAAKTAAHLVLSDNKFSSMPSVVAEGRQVVNNVQNSSTLFLMKTSMTVVLTVLLLVLRCDYPFQAKHLYGIEFGITGIATFLLTFKPNKSLIKGRFITNILKRMAPSGIAMALSVVNVYVMKSALCLNDNQISTVAMISATLTGLVALIVLLVPYDKYNTFVATVSGVFITAIFIIGSSFLNGDGTFMAMLSPSAIWFIVINVIVMSAIIVGGRIVIKKLDKGEQ